jgi:hypothetical protein
MSRNRSFIASDNVGRCCSCLECQAAEIIDRPIVRVPPDEYHQKSRWIHGEELKAYWTARDEAMGAVKALMSKVAMRETQS